MNYKDLLQIGLTLLGLSAALAVLVGNIYYVIRSKNTKIQKEEIEELRKVANQNQENFKHCQDDHKESQKDIHRLQGQVEILKDIPLKEINLGIMHIVETNSKILKTLRASAATLRKDTKAAKTAVRTVKTDPEEA